MYKSDQNLHIFNRFQFSKLFTLQIGRGQAIY